MAVNDIVIDARTAAREAVLVSLVRLYSSSLRRFFARRMSDQTDIQDLVQEVFVRITRVADPAEIEKPERYLFATAANVLKDHARRGVVRGYGLHDSLSDTDIVGSDLPIDRVLLGREAVARLQAALHELPERTRDVFVLRVLEGMKMADVAAAIGISTRAAEKHQAKALAHVTQALEEWRHP